MRLLWAKEGYSVTAAGTSVYSGQPVILTLLQVPTQDCGVKLRCQLHILVLRKALQSPLTGSLALPGPSMHLLQHTL